MSGNEVNRKANDDYDWLFYKFNREPTYSNGMLPQFQAYFRGDSSIKGARFYQPYRAYLKTGVISSTPHFHRDEEYLAFVGHDLRDAFDSFDAEIVLWMGEDYDDMEKVTITSPTMIRVPQFFWHGPIEITRLGKPLFFQPVLFNNRYYAIERHTGADGEFYFKTIVERLTPCIIDADETCNFCGKCRENG